MAIQSFLDTYRERLAQELQPDPSDRRPFDHHSIIAETIANLITVSSGH